MLTKVENQYQPDIVFHPGETLQDALEERQMGSKELAIRTGKPEKTISNVLNGKSSITAEMALQFESVLNIPAHFWLNKQASYDEFLARKQQQQAIDDAKEWARNFPYATMAKLGWVPQTRKVEEKAFELFDFFNIARKESWESYFLEQKLKASFRISLESSKCPYALSAWIMKGEQEASKMEVPEYNEKLLKEHLTTLRNIMTKAENNFQIQLKNCLLKAGVKVIFVPKLPKAPVNGLTRWIGNTPIIQLTDRWKRYDIFWFSLFHEIGHILLHKKKFISLENVNYNGKDLQKEKEADDFAIKWTFSEEEEKVFLSQFPNANVKEVKCYANEIGTHYSLIVGRLTHKKLIPHARAQQLNLLKSIQFQPTSHQS